MKFEISQKFFFEAAHTLTRQVDAEASRRVHGHTYLAEVTVCGTPDPTTGMVIDLAFLRAAVERARARVDHHLLDEIPELGAPTLENLCLFVWRSLEQEVVGLERVTISREASGDSCVLSRPSARGGML